MGLFTTTPKKVEPTFEKVIPTNYLDSEEFKKVGLLKIDPAEMDKPSKFRMELSESTIARE
mgnify:CR=1 FL=1